LKKLKISKNRSLILERQPKKAPKYLNTAFLEVKIDYFVKYSQVTDESRQMVSSLF